MRGKLSRVKVRVIRNHAKRRKDYKNNADSACVVTTNSYYVVQEVRHETNETSNTNISTIERGTSKAN